MLVDKCWDGFVTPWVLWVSISPELCLEIVSERDRIWTTNYATNVM